ncbi:MAG: hypothetical protein ACTSV7_15030 [Candidatus Baldrarchaeia archaeon]
MDAVTLILNKKAKIIVNGEDVYLGYVTAFDKETGLVELRAKGWRDRENELIPFRTIHTNIRYLTKVEYLGDDG